MSGTRSATRLLRRQRRRGRRRATVTRAIRAMDGLIWTPTAVGTTCLAKDKCGSPQLHWMPVLIPMGMAAGYPILAPDMFGPQDIRGAGFHFVVAPGPTGTVLVGDGLRSEAADERAGASALAAAPGCCEK